MFELLLYCTHHMYEQNTVAIIYNIYIMSKTIYA